jgi:hypothetical protein
MAKRSVKIVVTPTAAAEFDNIAIRFAARSKNLGKSLVLGYRALKKRIDVNPEIGQVYEEYTEKFGVEFHVARILVGSDSVRVFYLRETDRCTIFWFWNTIHPEDEQSLRESLEPFIRVE